MIDWDIGWAGRHRQYAGPRDDEPDSEAKQAKMTKGGGSTHSSRALMDSVTTIQQRRKLELSRSDLPRGGASLAAQIGAELRAVYGPPIAGELPGMDDLLAKIDHGYEDLS